MLSLRLETKAMGEPQKARETAEHMNTDPCPLEQLLGQQPLPSEFSKAS